MDKNSNLWRKDLLTKAEVLQLVGVDKRTLERWVASKTFPAPIRQTRKTIRWRSVDIRRHLGLDGPPASG